MIRVATVLQTGFASPSQWQGTLDDGRMVYARYRWGVLSVRVSASPTTDITDAVRGEEIVDVQLGNSLDGALDYDELKAATRDVVTWPEGCDGER